MRSGHILLADDEAAFRRLCGGWLTAAGHRVTTAASGDEAVAHFAEDAADLVLLDLVMPPATSPEAGLALVERFRPAPVVVLTAHADHALALRAVEAGAWDFLGKPVDPDLLRLVIGRALEKSALERELRALRQRSDDGDDLGLIGGSAAMTALRGLIRRVAPTDLPVLVLGPTGSGKELVARAIHGLSGRRDRPFVPVHCGAVPAELLESELFGHLKGSFTGADRDRPGLVDAAHGGTLFLDEIGEMPAAMQVKLLRFLQDGSYLPVGGRAPKVADVRLVSATHRDLDAMVAAGGFRDDLFYRIKGLVLRTPGLAERSGDIPLLAASFLAQAKGARARRLSPAALAWLVAHPWKGNVRELQALVQAATLLSETAMLEVADLEFADTGAAAPPTPAPPPAAPGATLPDQVEALERRLIAEALARCDGNHSRTARLLGISRVGLLKKMDRLGIARHDGP
ncbi:MAG: sigma-54-dependent Fis family transcriptional regulator [Rhodospirillaceae bacterium]|nr:sigma-54-dependent Fis family transcriptional regulator [Rhodospirillaceae bacterium]